VTSCFQNERVPPGWPEHLELIDNRYFYHNDNGIGGYTCGLVRNAVANQLLVMDRGFLNTKFLASLGTFIDNRSVIGFIIEYAVLASIKSKGLYTCEGSQDGMRLKILKQPDDIETDITNDWVLYRPLKYDHKAIDGIIVRIDTKTKYAEGEKPILSLRPLQITVAATHSDSRKTFLKEYSKWIKEQSRFDVRLEFLWITPHWIDGEKHAATSTWPEHHENYIHLEDVSAEIWEKYQKVTKDAKEAEPGGNMR